MIVPILLSLYFSFFDWNGISRTMNFTGLRNFVRAVTDQTFLNALRITFFFTIPGAVLGNAMGIVLAVLLNRPGVTSKAYRAVFFFPLLIGAVAIGFIWKAMLSYNGPPPGRSSRRWHRPRACRGPRSAARRHRSDVMRARNAGDVHRLHAVVVQVPERRHHGRTRAEGRLGVVGEGGRVRLHRVAGGDQLQRRDARGMQRAQAAQVAVAHAAAADDRQSYRHQIRSLRCCCSPHREGLGRPSDRFRLTVLPLPIPVTPTVRLHPIEIATPSLPTPWRQVP